jgi:glycerol-3-phosphate dehydrogenase (NAD(P)+)
VNNLELPVAVLGGGSWGTALARHLAVNGASVTLWAREEEVAGAINTLHENTVFLPGFPLPKNLAATTDLKTAVTDKALVVMVVPSEWLRETARAVAPFISKGAVVVSCTKGIEVGTRMTMSDILREELTTVDPKSVCALSGPSFAREVAAGFPTVVTVAASDKQVAESVQKIFASPLFRVYTNDDLVGVELAGAVKNVMAIASGICEGLGLGANTRAAVITRGLAELSRLGAALGAKPATFAGLAGVGDMVLTCTTTQSRNYAVGLSLGQGRKLSDILSHMRMVAEGVRNARSVYNLSKSVNVEMPIVDQVYAILYEDKPPKDAIFALMTRKLRDEQ